MNFSELTLLCRSTEGMILLVKGDVTIANQFL
jgi:hypothetical protein